MARVTVEDCITLVPNRFDLVMMAARRARDISSGAPVTVDRDRDKNPVVALREIAQKTVAPEVLQEELIKAHQRVVLQEEPEEEVVELMAGEQGWVGAQGEEAKDLNMFADDETGSDDADEGEDDVGDADDTSTDNEA